MPPKIKVTKEDIVCAAVELVKAEGASALNARAVAVALQCSTQPIFSNFATMEELRLAVLMEANERCAAYRRQEVEQGEYPPYKASGMAYIRFAKEEKELFKFLYMRDRAGEPMGMEAARDHQMEAIVQSNTGLDVDRAQWFHLEMWAFVHGIATMFATGFLDLEWTLVSQMLTDAYLGMRKQYETEE